MEEVFVGILSLLGLFIVVALVMLVLAPPLRFRGRVRTHGTPDSSAWLGALFVSSADSCGSGDSGGGGDCGGGGGGGE